MKMDRFHGKNLIDLRDIVVNLGYAEVPHPAPDKNVICHCLGRSIYQSIENPWDFVMLC